MAKETPELLERGGGFPENAIPTIEKRVTRPSEYILVGSAPRSPMWFQYKPVKPMPITVSNDLNSIGTYLHEFEIESEQSRKCLLPLDAQQTAHEWVTERTEYVPDSADGPKLILWGYERGYYCFVWKREEKTPC